MQIGKRPICYDHLDGNLFDGLRNMTRRQMIAIRILTRVWGNCPKPCKAGNKSLKLALPAGLLFIFGLTAMSHVGAEDWQTLYGAASADARQISSGSLAFAQSPADWHATVATRREMWLEMLGLSPLPPRTPLSSTVTGRLDRGDYVVEKLHFQSMPGAYVIGNLYRPSEIKGQLPAVIYLCGHSQGKVNPEYQAHARWFAQHGYIALILEPIQLGESQGFHHGTYRNERWDWPSRGYSPIGTEVWNAMRAIDYLESRADVDPDRIGVTGLSGGGVVSWCVGAADERLKVVVPVCQTGSIEHVVVNRATDGHCDCAFWLNYYRWCWPDIGALIVPRHFLIAAGADDLLWRPYAYRDVSHRIRNQYASLGVVERFELVEDLSPHGYTPKLRQAIFNWFNQHLKNETVPTTDDVTDFIEPTENLLVFGGVLPSDDAMSQIDTHLVKQGDIPSVGNLEAWKTHQSKALTKLRKTTFRNTVLSDAGSQKDFRSDGSDPSGIASTIVFETSDGMTLPMRTRHPLPSGAEVTLGSPSTVAFAVQPDATHTFAGGGPSRPGLSANVTTCAIEVRNSGVTSVGPGYLWTARRTYPLLGQTLPERQVSDLLAGINTLRNDPSFGPVVVFGKGYTAPLAIYAALLDPHIAEVILDSPPASHQDRQTPEFLGVLRIGDLPHNLALLFPRPITFVGDVPDAYEWTRQLYAKLGEDQRIRSLRTVQEWQPFAEE